MSDKQAVLKLVNRLPETVTLQDVLEEIKFMSGVKEGLAEIDQGKGVPIEAVEQLLETTLNDSVCRSRSAVESKKHGKAKRTPSTAIIRTERGLTISGTRITLYDIMDYVSAHYPSQFIQGLFNLTDEQIAVALDYIESHCQQVEDEYQTVIQSAHENQQYWEEQNRDLVARLAQRPPKPGTEKIWAKLNAQKAKHTAEAQSC